MPGTIPHSYGRCAAGLLLLVAAATAALLLLGRPATEAPGATESAVDRPNGPGRDDLVAADLPATTSVTLDR